MKELLVIFFFTFVLPNYIFVQKKKKKEAENKLLCCYTQKCWEKRSDYVYSIYLSLTYLII